MFSAKYHNLNILNVYKQIQYFDKLIKITADYYFAFPPLSYIKSILCSYKNTYKFEKNYVVKTIT